MFLVCSGREPAFAHARFWYCGKKIPDVQTQITAGSVEERAKAVQGTEPLVSCLALTQPALLHNVNIMWRTNHRL